MTSEMMKAWVLGNPGELTLVDKPLPRPGAAEVLVRVDTCAICATDLEVISHGAPAVIDGGPPFNRNYTPGHEYMGTVVAVGPTVDEFRADERVAVEIDPAPVHTHTFALDELPTALRYARERGEGAIKVVIEPQIVAGESASRAAHVIARP